MHLERLCENNEARIQCQINVADFEMLQRDQNSFFHSKNRSLQNITSLKPKDNNELVTSLLSEQLKSKTKFIFAEIYWRGNSNQC